NVLAYLCLPGEDGDLSVRADVQPGTDVLRRGSPSAPAASADPGGLRGRARQEIANQHAAAQRLQEIAPVEVELVARCLVQLVSLGLQGAQIRDWYAHRAASLTVWAALASAAMIRG